MNLDDAFKKLALEYNPSGWGFYWGDLKFIIDGHAVMAGFEDNEFGVNEYYSIKSIEQLESLYFGLFGEKLYL